MRPSLVGFPVPARHIQRWLVVSVTLLALLVLAACGGNNDENGNAGESPAPTVTEAPTEVPTEPAEAPGEVTPPATPSAAEPAQAITGYAETEFFSLDLPEGWLGYDVAVHGPEAVHAALLEDAPYVPMLVEGPAELAVAYFWAFTDMPGEAFVMNMNVVVGREPGFPEDPDELLEVLLPSHDAVGAVPLATDTSLIINDRPAIFLHVDLTPAGAAGVHSLQYVIIGEEGLYGLNFSLEADDVDEFSPVFEASARSFAER